MVSVNALLTRTENNNELSVYLLLVSMQMVKGVIFCICRNSSKQAYTFQNASRALETGTVSITKGVSNLVQESGNSPLPNCLQYITQFNI